MSTDAQNTYSTKQAIGTSTTVNSTNLIDHGTGGLGATEGLWLEVVVTTVFAGPSTTPIFILESDNDVAFGSPTDVVTRAASIALTPAGEYIIQVPVPPITERYTRVTASWTTDGVTGNFSAYLTMSPNLGYPQT